MPKAEKKYTWQLRFVATDEQMTEVGVMLDSLNIRYNIDGQEEELSE